MQETERGQRWGYGSVGVSKWTISLPLVNAQVKAAKMFFHWLSFWELGDVLNGKFHGQISLPKTESGNACALEFSLQSTSFSSSAILLDYGNTKRASHALVSSTQTNQIILTSLLSIRCLDLHLVQLQNKQLQSGRAELQGKAIVRTCPIDRISTLIRMEAPSTATGKRHIPWKT